MGKRRVRIILLSWCTSVIFCGTMLTDASAGSRQQKEQSSVESGDRLRKPLPNPALKKSIRQNKEQIPARAKAEDSGLLLSEAGAVPPPTDAQKKARPVHRQGKGSKKAKPQAVVKPRTDLTYHGILEGPSRYDPRQNRQTAGALDPQTPDLTHDHFQELDRNRDGMIDPVERAFGRLDMDRDVSARQWQ
jgi:hypothetical protein